MGIIMKSILISIKPKWVAKILNGEKTIEVRKNKALASAIQKLIDENGYADIYVYCSKSNTQYLIGSKNKVCEILTKSAGATFSPNIDKYIGNGKVIFKFRCYKVGVIHDFIESLEETEPSNRHITISNQEELLSKSCLTKEEIKTYGGNYAIHINDLEIFDKPKELSEFYKVGHYEDLDDYFTDEKHINGKWCIPLTKAPQNFCYVEELL